MDVIPMGEKATIGGLAIDIGTTTVSALLVDLETGKILAKGSTGNGQIRYGADVINRIIESTRVGGRKKLKKAIVDETLLPLIDGLCHEAKIPSDGIYRICVAGNTTMNHLLVGVNADPIRMEPYIPAFFETNSVFAVDLGIEVSSSTRVRIAPNVGSYVGGDITAGTLASGIWNRPEFSLFIDLGTNGELVFGNQDFLMTCACSAGPAFEGGDISCGMRATDGAIDSFRLDPATKEPILSVLGDPGQKPVGLCGSGIIDVICELFIHGIINAKGQIVSEGPRIHGNTDHAGIMYTAQLQHTSILSVSRIRRTADQSRQGSGKTITDQCALQSGIFHEVLAYRSRDSGNIADMLHHSRNRNGSHRQNRRQVKLAELERRKAYQAGSCRARKIKNRTSVRIRHTNCV